MGLERGIKKIKTQMSAWKAIEGGSRVKWTRLCDKHMRDIFASKTACFSLLKGLTINNLVIFEQNAKDFDDSL